MSEQFVAKLSGKGQLTLPKKLREKYGLKEGDFLLIFPQGQGLRVEKAAVSPLARFQEIAAETAQRFEKEGIEPETVEEAVRWARDQK